MRLSEFLTDLSTFSPKLFIACVSLMRASAGQCNLFTQVSPTCELRNKQNMRGDAGRLKNKQTTNKQRNKSISVALFVFTTSVRMQLQKVPYIGQGSVTSIGRSREVLLTVLLCKNLLVSSSFQTALDLPASFISPPVVSQCSTVTSSFVLFWTKDDVIFWSAVCSWAWYCDEPCVWFPAG